MNLLHKNLVEYILNSYLNYSEDILKLKLLYQYDSNIKPHLYHKIILNFGQNIGFVWIKKTYLDEIKLEERYFYEEDYKNENNKMNGLLDKLYENEYNIIKYRYEHNNIKYEYEN
jgi:hypothetical protein